MTQGVSVAKFLFIGAAIWFGALLLIRFSGSVVFSTQSLWLPLLFFGTIPGSWASIKVCLPLGGASLQNAVPAVALMSIAALLLDGIAFTWFPFAYGNEPQAIHLGAAWLLWAVGVFLAVSFLVAQARKESAGA